MQVFVGRLVKLYTHVEWPASLELWKNFWAFDSHARLRCRGCMKNGINMWAKDSEMFQFRDTVPNSRLSDLDKLMECRREQELPRRVAEPMCWAVGGSGGGPA